MEPVFVDLHIHTSENPDNLNYNYDVTLLKKKISEFAEGTDVLISLTDHNAINKPIYLEATKLFDNLLIGAELHIRNQISNKTYHCHIFFNFDIIAEAAIDGINLILDELYPKKVVPRDDESIPTLEHIINSFDPYEFILLPHGGQNHATFNKSIKKGANFDSTLERNIYYNHFDGFTARSNKGLEKTIEYLTRLGINDFVNLVTSTDNYTPNKYPSAKDSKADPFVPTWMLAKPTFNGLRLSLSESSRLIYGDKPDAFAQHVERVVLNKDNINIDVTLKPGLNVVIGGSSSGKTLFVDSIYRKITNDFSNSNYRFTQYPIEDLLVVNPSGKTPYYIEQNFISTVCDFKDKETTVADIPILNKVFPSDKEERKAISIALNDLSDKLNILIDSVKEIEKLHTELGAIANPAHLIITEAPIGNPLAQLIPSDQNVGLIEYGLVEHKKDIKALDKIDSFLTNNPLVDYNSNTIATIKKYLQLAREYSIFELNIREVISEQKTAIDYDKEKESLEIASKTRDFEKLLNAIERYNIYNQIFYSSLFEISNFSVEISTKKITLMKHQLLIRNEFKLTSEIFLNSVNDHLKNKIDNFDQITPESLFKRNYKDRPKVAGYDDLKHRINLSFKDMDKQTYSIIAKDGRDFDKLSAGWKASIVLDLILGSDSDNAPIIIDQPEDNLASEYINSDLISAIKYCKSRKQIILVSHNATIPMLADAQNVIVCENDLKKISIQNDSLEGAVSGKNIVDIIAEKTDGGKASIKKRVKKYNLKKFRGET